MGENEEFSSEINNINIVKTDNGMFRIIFGTKTDIPDLYSASTELEVTREMLEEFVENANEALNKK